MLLAAADDAAACPRDRAVHDHFAPSSPRARVSRGPRRRRRSAAAARRLAPAASRRRGRRSTSTRCSSAPIRSIRTSARRSTRWSNAARRSRRGLGRRAARRQPGAHAFGRGGAGAPSPAGGGPGVRSRAGAGRGHARRPGSRQRRGAGAHVPKRPAPAACWRSARRRIPWDGRRCARRWAAPSGCRPRASVDAAALLARGARRRRCRSSLSTPAASPPADLDLTRPTCLVLGGEGRGVPAGGARPERRPAAAADAAARGITERRGGRRPGTLRGRRPARGRAVSGGLFDDPAAGAAPAAAGAAGRADAPAHARRDRRPGGAARSRPPVARGDPARRAAVGDPLGTAGHRQDDAGARHRRRHRRRVRRLQRRARRASRRSRR